MIGISSTTADAFGAITLSDGAVDWNRTKIGSISRRATRTATIDGGAYIYDAGYTASDRTFSVAIKSAFDRIDDVRSIVRNYESVLVTTSDGAFLANPSSIKENSGYWVLTLNVSAES